MPALDEESRASCPEGYTADDIVRILGDRAPEFWKWMNGQTMMVCDGRKYNHELREYEPTECWNNPHDGVVYRSDFNRFVNNLPIYDW